MNNPILRTTCETTYSSINAHSIVFGRINDYVTTEGGGGGRHIADSSDCLSDLGST